MRAGEGHLGLAHAGGGGVSGGDYEARWIGALCRARIDDHGRWGGFNLEDKFDVVPCMVMLITMPISGSIGHGIGLGLITYTVMKVFTGKAKDVSILTYVISILFIVKFRIELYRANKGGAQ